MIGIGGKFVAPLGQGTSHLGEGRRDEGEELRALRTGIDLNMRLIDTAEVYAHGASEVLVGKAIAPLRRADIFLVSKLWHEHTNAIAKHCEASLKRLGTEYIDLYLLHWPIGITSFDPIVEAFERLIDAGKISDWGVSNFSVTQLEELFHLADGERCAVVQNMYSLNNREMIEKSVLPWCVKRYMPVMAYSPLSGPGAPVLAHSVVRHIAKARGVPPSAIALAWVIRSGHVIAIPEAGCGDHVRQNAAAMTIHLTREELRALDGHPAL